METLRKRGDTFKELSLDHRGTRYHASLVYIPVIKWYALVFADTTRVIRFERFIPILATVLVSIFLSAAVLYDAPSDPAHPARHGRHETD